MRPTDTFGVNNSGITPLAALPIEGLESKAETKILEDVEMETNSASVAGTTMAVPSDTKTRILLAIESLVNSGGKINQRTVREAMGAKAASFSHIQPVLKEWRDQKNLDFVTPETKVPDELKDLSDHLLAALYQRAVNSATNQLAVERMRVEELRQEFDRDLIAMAGELSTLQALLSESREALAVEMGTTTKLRSEIRDAVDSASSLQVKLAESTQSLSLAKEQLHQLEGKNDELNLTIQELQTEAGRQEAQLESLKALVEERDLQLTRCESAYKVSQRDLQSLTVSLGDAKETMARQEAELQGLRQQVSDANRHIGLQLEEINALKANDGHLRQKIHAAQVLSQRQDEQIANLHATAKDTDAIAREKEMTLRLRVQELESQIVQLQAEREKGHGADVNLAKLMKDPEFAASLAQLASSVALQGKDDQL